MTEGRRADSGRILRSTLHEVRIPVKSTTRYDAKPIGDFDTDRSPVGAKRRGPGSWLRVVAPPD